MRSGRRGRRRWSSTTPGGRRSLAAAVGAAQKGKRQLEEVQGRVLRAAGLPTKGDYDEVAKSMARLKRKLRDLAKQVDGGAEALTGWGAPGILRGRFDRIGRLAQR